MAASGCTVVSASEVRRRGGEEETHVLLELDGDGLASQDHLPWALLQDVHALA